MADKRVLVVGAGVIGLTTANVLQDAKYSVTIRAGEVGGETTSARAAAIWEPYLPQLGPSAGEALKNIRAWGKQAYEEFRNLSTKNDDPQSGVKWARILELKRTADTPAWEGDVDNFKTLAGPVLRAKYGETYAQGFAFDTPIIDMSRYLTYLEARFRSHQPAGGQAGWIDPRPVRDLAEELANYDAVVNCTGLDGAALAGDEQHVIPALGQVVRIKRGNFEGFQLGGEMNIEAIVDDGSIEDLAYIVPRTDDIVLGGTYIPRRYEDYAKQRGNAGYTPSNSQPPDDDVKMAILQRCARLAAPLNPEFAMSIARLVSESFADELADRFGRPHRSTDAADITDEKCGLRPARDGGPRVERDPHYRGLIHNYGHAGAGVTLSWGCAEAVKDLLT